MVHLRAAVVVSVAGFLLFSCAGNGDGTSAASAPWDGAASGRDESSDGEAEVQQPELAVDAMEVTRGALVETVEASGRVRGAQEVRIVSEVEGTIRSAPFELGDAIGEGAVLLEVDPTLAALRLEEAQKLLEGAEIDLAAVQRRYENGSASQSELIRARSAADGARTRQRAAEKEYQDHFIRAPISGRIAAREEGIGRGNYITRGSVVARIVNLETVELQVGLGEDEIGLVETGSSAEINIPACGTVPVSATVYAMAAGSDARTGSYAVVIRWENRCENLRSGMSAVASISVQNDLVTLLIPGSAIGDGGDEAFVWVVDGNTAEKRTVETGRRMGDRVEVLTGLDEGEIIAVSAISSLTEGRRVNAVVRGSTGDNL